MQCFNDDFKHAPFHRCNIQRCQHSIQYRNNVVTLCCAENRHCESSWITSPLTRKFSWLFRSHKMGLLALIFILFYFIFILYYFATLWRGNLREAELMRNRDFPLRWPEPIYMRVGYVFESRFHDFWQPYLFSCRYKNVWDISICLKPHFYKKCQ